MTKKEQPSTEKVASEAIDSGNVDQIRDYEKRFTRLDALESTSSLP